MKAREAAAYWAQQKAHLKQLLAVDYPAAMARRSAAVPDADRVGAFGLDQLSRFYDQHPKESKYEQEQRRVNETSLRTAEDQLSTLRECLVYGRASADATPVNDHLTIRDLASLVLADSPYFKDIRGKAAVVERGVYGNEAAAQQVESMQSPGELASFLEKAAARYAETNRQITEATGYDARAYNFKTEERYRIGVFNFASLYQGRTETELWQITDAYDKACEPLDVRSLAEASRDDEESRRLLTELKEMQALRQATIGHRWDQPKSWPK